VTETFRTATAITPGKLHLRAGIWDVPSGVEPRAICMLLEGQTEFLEKYGEVAGELVARGFTVVSFDWRSQGASERSRAGNRASHVASFEDYDSDLAAVMMHVVEPLLRAKALPVIGLAHSMGGHLLLRYLHEHPRRFAAAALVAPMLEIETGKYSPEVAALVTRLLNLRKPSMRFVLGAEGRDPLHAPFEGNLLTSDKARFERTKAFLKKQPFLRVYGATFGWLGAALRSCRQLMRAGFAEEIATPVLLCGAGKDRVVKTKAVRDYAKRMPKARYVEIEEAEHEILMETDAIRARFWAEFDAFMDMQLATAIPFAPPPRPPVKEKPIRTFTGKTL
jgi:lysophospholipase